MTTTSAEELCRRGDKLLKDGQPTAALTLFMQGLLVAKESNAVGTLHYNIAVCHARTNNKTDAIAALTEAIKAYPQHLRAIKKGGDFPELAQSPEFATFLEEATEHGKSRLQWRIAYWCVWLVVIFIWIRVSDTSGQSGKTVSGSTLFMIAVGLQVGIELARATKRKNDKMANDSLAQNLSATLDPSGNRSTQHYICPQCGLPYKLSDYREDAQHIFCSDCRAELPR